MRDEEAEPATGPAADRAGARSGAPTSTGARLEHQLLGGPRTLTLAQLAERAESDVEQVRLFWHALGLPTAGPDEVAYTEADATALRNLMAASRHYDVSPRTGVSLVRSIGHTTDRLVLWQVEALVEHVSERFDLDDASARLTVLDRLAEIAPLLEEQLVHAWRRQLAAIAERFADEFGQMRGSTAAQDELPLARAVGFVDIVSFTTRTAELGAHELSEFVQSFEARARDVVTAAGGRVVKTVGDAVLFVADDAGRGAQVALGLADAFGPDSPAPARVSMVWGRVLSRFGDVFGRSVNLAARLSDEARPGTVLVDAGTATLLSGQGGLVLTERPALELTGLGRVRPVLLSRAR